MKARILQALITTLLLLGLSSQSMFAIIVVTDKLCIGNIHRLGCTGLGICDCPGRPGPTCPLYVDVEFAIVGENTITADFHDLPSKLRTEQIFGTSDVVVSDPQQYGYKSITIVEGDYPFDWNTERVTMPFAGQRDPSVLFSNLSVPSTATGDKYQESVGWPVSGSASPVGVSTIAASQFTPVNSGSAYRLDLALGLVSGENAFTVSIYSDNDGQPGALLWSQAGITTGQNYPGCCGVITVVLGGAVTLSGDTDYWIAVGPSNPGSSTLGMWNQNKLGKKGKQIYSNDGGTTWQSNGQALIGAFDLMAQ